MTQAAVKNDYHYLPIDVTENQTYGIEVIVKLVNPNYRFVTEQSNTVRDHQRECCCKIRRLERSFL